MSVAQSPPHDATALLPLQDATASHPVRADASLESVRHDAITDTPKDETFDRFAALARQVFDVPIAVISVVEGDRVRFESRLGIDACEIPGELGLRASAILGDDVWVVPDAALDPRTRAHPLVTGESALRFLAAVPLTAADGRNLGTLSVMDRVPHQVTARQTDVLRDLGRLVVDQLDARRLVGSAERRLAEVQHLADALQRSLLPPALPAIPYLDVAASYQPASRYEVGGDFYDVFPVDSWSWGMVIGDVCGKGPCAASRTSGARYAVRAAAIQQPEPDRVLEVVNHALINDPSSTQDAAFMTMLYARVLPDPNGTRVTFSSAGHHQPVVVRADGRIELAGAPGTLLGAFDTVALGRSSVRLDAGDTMLLYTDGIVDSGEPERLGLDGLLTLLRGGQELRPAHLVDRVCEAVGAAQRDDVAVVALRAYAEPA